MDSMPTHAIVEKLRRPQEHLAGAGQEIRDFSIFLGHVFENKRLGGVKAYSPKNFAISSVMAASLVADGHTNDLRLILGKEGFAHYQASRLPSLDSRDGRRLAESIPKMAEAFGDADYAEEVRRHIRVYLGEYLL